jgi:outer membrane protein OmpA-like peptidoglycan-associated protein
MKVRYSAFAAVLAAGASLALPGAAIAADEKEDAANNAKWACVIDNKCDGTESAVGEGIDGPSVRPVIDDDRAPSIARTITGPAPKRPVLVQKSALRSPAARPMSTGRRSTDVQAVAAPEAVSKGSDLFVTFRRNSAELESGVTSDMRSLAKVMRDSLAAGNKRIIQVGGHTDATGDEAFNLKLSQERAEVVRKSLIELGVPAESIQSTGFGEAKPIDGYAPTHGVNRRVEVVVLN